jgi:hypothetical protein
VRPGAGLVSFNQLDRAAREAFGIRTHGELAELSESLRLGFEKHAAGLEQA